MGPEGSAGRGERRSGKRNGQRTNGKGKTVMVGKGAGMGTSERIVRLLGAMVLVVSMVTYACLLYTSDAADEL